MSEKKDLVVKMTINSTDFDNGLKNAKSSMKKFESNTSIAGKTVKSFISGAVKGFGALGVAVTGAEMFKSFINSTQSMGDAWNNAMVSAKTSFQVLETAVASGSSTILDNFRQSISAAREFALAMDALGSAKISNQYARMEYVTPFNEEMTKYRDAKSKGNTTGMAFAAANMERYLSDYRTNAQNIMMASRNAVVAKLSAYTGGFVNEDNLDKYLDQLYLEIINGVFPPILKDFRNLDVELQKGDYFYNKAKDEMEKNYGPGWRREAEAMNALAEINDSTLNEMLEVIKTYDSVRNEINGMRRQMVRVMGSENGTKTPKSASLSLDQQLEMTRRMIQSAPVEYRPFEAMIEEEDIIEADTDALVASVVARMEAMKGLAEQTAMAVTTVNALGSSFNSIGSIAADTTFGKIASSLGQIITQATATISAMMALAGAETIEGLAETFSKAPVGTKIALTATALAGILGMISSVKSTFAGSYANGGIVPGSSYTGDKLWARVNSGEMIVPYRDWHNASGGGNVHFVIEGSQLKGVLDNYESIKNM